MCAESRALHLRHGCSAEGMGRSGAAVEQVTRCCALHFAFDDAFVELMRVVWRRIGGAHTYVAKPLQRGLRVP